MAVADDILAAVKLLVEEAFTGRTCHVRRGSELNPEVWPDMSPPCFFVKCNEDRPTKMAWARKKFVTYPVEVGFVTIETPGDRNATTANPEVRGGTIEDVINAVARLFLACRDENNKPGLRGVPEVNTCEVKPLAPYKLPFAAKTVNVSRVRLEFETIEDA